MQISHRGPEPAPAALRAWSGGVALAAACAIAQAQPLSESDYYAEIPVVLTASRLEQSLHDAPGAVTVLDRALIRRLGARDISELLRLVPGYLVSGNSGSGPNVAYHAPLGEFSRHNLVLVDGRSVYSSSLYGDTLRGLRNVVPDEIERIEVLRGANSAAYGANAMFGVINIVTRHALDAQGVEFSASRGNSVNDMRFGYGWGDEQLAQRLSVSRRSDSGYVNAADDRRLDAFNWRADLRPAGDELMLAASASTLDVGYDHIGTSGDPPHRVDSRDWSVQGRWQRELDGGAQLRLSADYSVETYDHVLRLPYRGVIAQVDYSRAGRRGDIELQHQLPLSQALRAVWGLGWKQEKAGSWPLYTQTDPVGYHEQRAFGHLEWKPFERWTVNVGALAASHSLLGHYATPRLMLNYHVSPDHTLRFGSNQSLRTNSLIELLADTRFYSTDGALLRKAYAGNPAIRPESLRSLELSYLGHFRPLRLTVDARAYNEHLDDSIGLVETPLVKYPRVFTNVEGFTLSGVEYQLLWTPREGTRLQWQQNFSRMRWGDPAKDYLNRPPVRASTLAWIERLPHSVDLALILSERGEMSWHTSQEQLPRARRVDLRLAHPWRVGPTKAELALSVQSLNGSQLENVPDVLSGRRAFLTLKLEH